jgi:transcriptional regulator with XRE-family HTH domain
MLSKFRARIREKLENRAYRHEFFRVQAQDEIATRIRELRESRGLTQEQLAKQCGMKQSAISRIEDASYSRWSFRTLWRVAEALDARIRVILEPMEEAVKAYDVDHQYEAVRAWLEYKPSPALPLRAAAFVSHLAERAPAQSLGEIKGGPTTGLQKELKHPIHQSRVSSLMHEPEQRP